MEFITLHSQQKTAAKATAYQGAIYCNTAVAALTTGGNKPIALKPNNAAFLPKRTYLCLASTNQNQDFEQVFEALQFLVFGVKQRLQVGEWLL